MTSPQRCLSVILFCMFLAGCSSGPISTPERVSVSGKILLPNGNPLTGGTLVLRPESGLFGATGMIQPDGTFVLQDSGKQDVVPGKYQVFVRFGDSELATFKSSVKEIYWQSSDDADSDVAVDIQGPTDDLVIQLKI